MWPEKVLVSYDTSMHVNRIVSGQLRRAHELPVLGYFNHRFVHSFALGRHVLILPVVPLA